MNPKQQRARQKKQEKHRRKRKAEVQRKRYDPNDIRWVAAHEAGHAVAALAFGIPLEFVDVRRRRLPDGTASLGFTSTPPLNAAQMLELSEDEVFTLLIQSMAGPAAEALADPRYAFKAGADDGDRRDALQLATIALCESIKTPDGLRIARTELAARQEEIAALCIRAEYEAARFVDENQAAIEAVAAALIQKTSLTGDEVAAIIAAAKG